MKTITQQLTPGHRQARLPAPLVASTLLAFAALAPFAALAQGVEPPGKPMPKRLPAVLASTSAYSAKSKPLVTAEAAIRNPVVDATRSGETASTADKASARWLRSSSATAKAAVARRLISQAASEYGVGASLSAETSAWDAIRWAAEAVDLAQREHRITPQGDSEARSLIRLRIARQAIREARDFSGAYGSVNAEAITRMAKSHATDVLDNQPTHGLSATDASDRYLDHARVLLAPIAAQSVEAAQAMDLLAAIYLGRADSKTLPSSTALCLRRAALQGQPNNASLASRLGMHLADVGLIDEARWALEHSLSLESDPATAEALVKVLRRSGQGDDAARLIASMQNHTLAASSALPTSKQQDSRIKIPQVTQLSPADFAALSKPVMHASSEAATANASLVSAKTKVIAVPDGQNVTAKSGTGNSIGGEEKAEEKPAVISRLLNSFKRFSWSR